MIPYNPQGLTPEEVAASRAAHGENIITPQRDDSAWRLLAEKFRDPIIIVLLVAAALSLAMAFMEGNFTETIGILCAILLATCVGFLFEWDAMRRFRRLNRVNDEQPVKVRRGGVMREIPRREVVVGDLVSLEAGETVPADGELVEAVSLQMDESTLTGEPETAKYVDEELFDPEATYPSNRLLRGTTVRDGYGRMVVTAVGDATEAGRVTEQATVQSGEQTPLHRQLTRLSRQIGKVGIALSVLIFVILIGKAFLVEGLADAPWPHVVRIVLNCFMVSVAMIVMAVPEGLPMSITLSLALSMRRMLKTNNLVRKMHACETMGAVTVICTDKTGTLTQNRMRVQEIIRYGLPDERLLGESVAANSTAFLDADGRPLGNPTEGALLEWLRRENGDYAALREGVRILDRLTFSPERKYMATLIERCDTRERFLLIKGAPEVVLARCDAATVPAEIQEQLLGMQRRAMRTLALAYVPTNASRIEEAEEPYRLAAVAAIADPVREEVPAAVAECMSAGIAVKIVTGDTAATATEIARQIGLWNDAEDTDRNRMTGVEFEAASDEELLARIGSLKILSRARPLDKQRLVRLLQQQGEVVAVTGDGTNDAPALNFANVGLSMGSGTSVAKDASDITLLDDSFRSIATAVMWGRSLYRHDQLRGDRRLPRRLGHGDRNAAHGDADPVGQHHHGHAGGHGHGIAAAAARSDARTPPPARCEHRLAGDGAHDRHLRLDLRGRPARNARLVALHDGRAHRAPAHGILHDLRLPAILEPVQRQRIRSRMRGEPRHRAQPDVPHRAGAHRAGAMAHRRTRRRGLPHRPALVAGVGLDRGAHLAHRTGRRGDPRPAATADVFVPRRTITLCGRF